MHVARLGLRRIATALAAAGAVLLAIAPLLPLAEGAPVEGLRNSLFWQTPVYQWACFVLAAVAVVVAFALWDSASRARIAGPLLLAFAGIGSTLLAIGPASSDLLDRCNWGYEYAGLTTGFFRPCVGLSGRYDPAEALVAAMLGGTLLLAAGLILPLTATFSPPESERRRRRLRSFSYM